jgi:hypothetical protein
MILACFLTHHKSIEQTLARFVAHGLWVGHSLLLGRFAAVESAFKAPINLLAHFSHAIGLLSFLFTP